MMVGLKVYGLPIDEWPRAHKVAVAFMEKYPDRRGIRDCVVYGAEGHPALIVYRTDKFVIVRGSEK